MNLKNINEFKNILKSDGDCSSFIIYGDDIRVITEGTQIAYKKINKFQELNLIKLKDDMLTLENVVNSLETLPFMSDKKLVHFFNPPFFNEGTNSVYKEIKDYLIKFVGLNQENVIILITYDSVIPESDKLLAAIKASGYTLNSVKPKGEALYKWISSLFEECGKSISKSDIIYIVNEIGTEMNTLKNEVDKICSFAIDEDNIKKYHIDSIITKTLENSIFKMVDNMSKKNVDNSMKILNTLIFQKEDPLKILGMIIRQYRMMYQIKILLKLNTPANEIAKKLKLRDFMYQNLYKQLQGYTESNLSNQMNKCLEIDRSIKNGKIEASFALELLVVEMCK